MLEKQAPEEMIEWPDRDCVVRYVAHRAWEKNNNASDIWTEIELGERNIDPEGEEFEEEIPLGHSVGTTRRRKEKTLQ